MSKIISIEQVGQTAKITYDNNEVIYSWSNGRHKISADNDTIETVIYKLAPEDKYHQQEYRFSDQEVTYGTENAVEYVEYLINNGFFLTTTIIGDTEGDTVNVTNKGLDVNIQDQHTPSVDSYFIQSISNFTLASDTPVSTITTLEYDFTAAPAHGIAIGNEILLLDITADRSFQAMVLNVVGDIITLDTPIDHIFPSAIALGRIVTSEMAVNGSVTPQIFSVRAGVIPSDITRTLLTMTGGSSMDDGKFGSLDALDRGLIFRIVNGYQQTIFNFKTNQEIKQFCFDVRYSDKAPAGLYGLSARMTFGGQDKHGVTLRISGLSALQWIVQDDLTGALSIKASDQGHHVED